MADAVGPAVDASDNPIDFPQPPQDPQPLSTMDAVWLALETIGGTLLVIAYLAIALRFVAFATSENIHKPLPFRVLIGIYTFIFAPLFIPYYLYRAYRGAWGTAPFPVAYSIFPMNYFREGEEYDLLKSISGIPATKRVSKVIEEQTTAENEARKQYLADTVVTVAAAAATTASIVNPTIRNLLSSVGVVLVGFVLTVILFTIYQALAIYYAPPPPPPTCTPPPPPPESMTGSADQAKGDKTQQSKWPTQVSTSLVSTSLVSTYLSSLLPTTVANFFQLS